MKFRKSSAMLAVCFLAGIGMGCGGARFFKSDGECAAGGAAAATATPAPTATAAPATNLRDELHARMLDELELTPEQRTRMEEIDRLARSNRTPEDNRNTMQSIAGVLTPEQLKKFNQLAKQGDRLLAKPRKSVQ